MTTLKLYPIYHALCGEIAFYTTRLLVPNMDSIIPNEVYFPNGTQPMDGDYIVCGHCHNNTMDDYFGEPFSYKDDQPVEVTFDQVKT
ncbi:MAG: hypothetical protein J0M11_01410 [Anaerolineae bacterium]|nr:hypothetical protein [Anaerolineae bacterium]